MIKILTASFKGITGVTHSIKIYDVDQTGDDLETTAIAETPGYVLDSNAGITDVMQGGIIETSASFSLRNQDGVLADLIEGLTTSPEGRYLVQLERGGAPFWRGIILSDFSNREDFPEGGYSFTATDGMALLKTIPIDTQNPPTGETVMERMMITIIKGLRQIPTVNLWNTGTDNKFVYCKTDWYGENMNDEQDPLYQAYFRGTALWKKVTEKEGYNGVISKIIEPMNYKEVLQHIMERFNAFLIMQDGAWYIMQRDLAADSPITFYTYRAFPQGITQIWIGTPYQVEKSVVASVMPKAVIPDKRYRANGEFSFLPALSKVSVIYGGGNLEDGNDSIIPAGFLEDHTYTTMPLDGGAGNYLHLRIKFKEWFLIDWPTGPIPQHDFKAKVYYNVLVKQGNYYLSNTGAWTLTPQTASYLITPISQLRHYMNNDLGQYVLQDWVEVDFDRITQDLPLQDTEVTLLLTRANVTIVKGAEYGFTVDINDNFNYTPDLENHFLLYIVDNEGPVTYASFEAENDIPGFMNEVELTPSLFGTARVIQNSNFSSYSTGGWAITELWGKGYAGDKDKYFNALLVHEMIGNQGKNLLMFSGDIHDRESSLMTPIQCIAFKYEPDLFADVYLLTPNKISYFAQEERWTGDWIEVFHLDIMPPAPLPNIFPWVVHPGLPMDIELLPKVVDAGTGDVDTTGGGGTGLGQLPGTITSSAIRTVMNDNPPVPTTGLISVQPNLKGVLKQTDEFGNTKTVGADASDFKMNPAGVTITGGFLYNWLVTQEANLISTADWAVPTSADFATLIKYLIGEGFNYDDTTSGNKIGKAVATASGWDASATTGAVGNTDYPAKRNVTGLSIKPVGQREGATGDYLFQGGSAYIWSADASTETLSELIVIFNSLALVASTTLFNETGCSIRLFRTATVPEQAEADGTVIVDAYTGNDGKVYQGVKLGTQVWLSENLAETLYSDGTEIPLCEPAEIWAALTVPRRCAYDNDITEAYTDDNEELIFKNGKKLPADQISYDPTISGLAAVLVKTALDELAEFISPASTESPTEGIAGKIRYRSDSNNSYCEMVMQTGASTYAWVVIKTNTW